MHTRWSRLLKIECNIDLPFLELPFRVPDKTFHLYWNISKDEDPATRWMRQLIKDTVME